MKALKIDEEVTVTLDDGLKLEGKVRWRRNDEGQIGIRTKRGFQISVPVSQVEPNLPPMPPMDHVLMDRKGFVYQQWEDEETNERYFAQAAEGSPRISWADMQRDAPFRVVQDVDPLQPQRLKDTERRRIISVIEEQASLQAPAQRMALENVAELIRRHS